MATLKGNLLSGTLRLYNQKGGIQLGLYAFFFHLSSAFPMGVPSLRYINNLIGFRFIKIAGFKRVRSDPSQRFSAKLM
jgi:hypothetical protein